LGGKISNTELAHYLKRRALGKCAAFTYHVISIKSGFVSHEPRHPSAMRHGGTPSRRMRQIKESAK